MDVVKTQKKSFLLWRSTPMWLTSLALVIFALLLWALIGGASLSVARANLLIETVQQGDLAVVIEGYGSLISNKQQLLTTLSSATVKQIVLKPGAQVNANSVIAYLENPELNQQVENAEQELIQAQANLRQLKLTNQRETLTESANVAEISALSETAELKRIAEAKLVDQGIVSQLTFQQTELDAKQLKQRIAILQQRIEQLALVHAESVNIQLERIKQQQGRLNIAQSRLDKLTIRAGFDGVLQRLSVELGQSLSPGQEVALIGSVTDLIALIRVPQSQAQLITIGKTAIIDTRRDKITGQVSRIDPIVDNNTVEIEVALSASLPASARPQLSVDGTIIADTLQDVSYIKRPVGALANTLVALYRVDNAQSASLQELRFGVQAGQNMQIVSGAKAGEQFIISDLSNLQNTHQTLTIN